MFIAGDASTKTIILSKQVFLITHVVLPALSLMSLFTLLEWSGWDLRLSAVFYDFVNHQWPFKDDFVIQKVLHKGGRLFYFAVLSCILAAWLVSFRMENALKQNRLAVLYLLLASISGPLLILYLKNHTHIYCPWDLLIFENAKPYIRWFDSVPPESPVGHCFPAAHAGSGYAFLSWYFFLWVVQENYKGFGLAFGLMLGAGYGLTQQMRGAHFMSHDVVSLLICWFFALFLFLVFFRKRLCWV